MNAPARSRPVGSLHPALWVAALSVTLFSVVGIARMSGWLGSPTAIPQTAPASPEAPVVDASPAPSSQVAVAPPAAQEKTLPASPRPEPAPKVAASKPATHKVEARHAVHRVGERTGTTVKVADTGANYDSGIDLIPAPPPVAHEPTVAPVCAQCGLIESVRELKVAADASGLGAAAGGVVGGLLGNQVGKGSGRTIATLIGIAGGAYAGHQVEKTQRTASRWEVGVRLENGDYRTVSFDNEPPWRTGDRVRLEGQRIVPAS
ncbi:outer membrane lipoprotein [Methyloversatilis thermotolerans]|uniref:glycine zipper 2TM domain-containing protein n=1 Tax=Methyloversatilis thermotolerans TaxID=1346290 RepID=UPI00039DF3AE|nr:glycine zipper 2TM domain-containing protein [Methyloversatilis thermotolerans]